MLTELHNRGLKDGFIAGVEGLTGFPEAIPTVHPRTKVPLCIVHRVRHTLRYVADQDRRAVVADLKRIDQATTVADAERALETLAEHWEGQYPSLSQLWWRHWEPVITGFDDPEDLRRAIYTTNAIESLNSVIRQAINKPAPLPQRPFRPEGGLPGQRAGRPEMDPADPGLETGPQPVRPPVRGTVAVIVR